MAEWYEQLLELQLHRNREIWSDLEEHGIDDETELRLGFLYASRARPRHGSSSPSCARRPTTTSMLARGRMATAAARRAGW
ncbi:MAG: hypothetical protein Q8O56_02670 [Solirubrobacteraceae bacterium]|nr:hypothetical protein [Solirubrobacteraceae bacterium]